MIKKYINRLEVKIRNVRKLKESAIDKVPLDVLNGNATPSKSQKFALEEASMFRDREKALMFHRALMLLLFNLIKVFFLGTVILAVCLIVPPYVGAVKIEYYSMMAQFLMVVLVGFYVLPLVSKADGRPSSVRIETLSNNIIGVLAIINGLFVCFAVLAIGAGSTPMFVMTIVAFIYSVYLILLSIYHRDS